MKIPRCKVPSLCLATLFSVGYDKRSWNHSAYAVTWWNFSGFGEAPHKYLKVDREPVQAAVSLLTRFHEPKTRKMSLHLHPTKWHFSTSQGRTAFRVRRCDNSASSPLFTWDLETENAFALQGLQGWSRVGLNTGTKQKERHDRRPRRCSFKSQETNA